MASPAPRASAVGAARWSVVQGVGGVVLQFATLAVLARLLSPAVFGAMAIVFVVHRIASLFAQMGLSSALIQRKDLTPAARDSLYWLTLLLGVLACVIVFLAAPFVAAAFALPELTDAIRVIALTFVISGIAAQYQALAQRELRLRRMALINLAALLATAVVAIALALLGYGLWALVAGLVAAAVVRAVAFFLTGIRDHGLPSLRFVWDEARELVAFGAHRFGAMLVNAVNTYVDQFLIGLLLGPQPLGYYSVANRLVRQPVDLVNPIVTRVAFPWLSRAQDDDQRLESGYLRILRLVTAVNAPVMVAAAVLAPWYVPLLLGPGWTPAIPLIQILAAYSLLRSAINAGGSLILAKGRADWTFYWNLALLPVFPIALFLAARYGDVRTLALTLVGVQFVVLLLYHRFLIQPLIGLGALRFLAAIAMPTGVALVAGALVLAALRILAIDSDLAGLVLGVALGGIAYVALARWLMPEQFAEMRRILFARLGRSPAH